MSLRRGIAVIAAAAALVGGACDRGAESPDGGAPESGAAPAPEPSPGRGPHGDPIVPTGPPEPSAPEFAVPAQVDVPYVERILAELDRVQGDVVRGIVERRVYGPEERAAVRAVFNDPEFAVQSSGFAALVEGLDRARTPPGDNVSKVTALRAAGPTCIYAETLVDVSATVLEPPPPYRVFVLLRPSQAGTDPGQRNPTPWSIAAEHPEPRDPCR